jgi:hypothetical protein
MPSTVTSQTGFEVSSSMNHAKNENILHCDAIDDDVLACGEAA